MSEVVEILDVYADEEGGAPVVEPLEDGPRMPLC